MPDRLCAGAYRLEIISTTLQQSGIVHRPGVTDFWWVLIDTHDDLSAR